MEFFALNFNYIFLVIYRLLTGERSLGDLPPQVIAFWNLFQGISVMLSLLFLAGIIYAVIRLSQVRKAEQEAFNEASLAALAGEAADTSRDERWDRVLGLVNSENPNEWRQAIIEADGILDDVLIKRGYPGETLGERLRGIEKGDLQALDEAWEAHKVRNRVAHDGMEFQLSRREALRVIDLYKRVFEEFQIV